MQRDNEIDGNDNNGQRDGKVEGGERKIGRLSQTKNDHAPQDEYPTQYSSQKNEEQTE